MRFECASRQNAWPPMVKGDHGWLDSFRAEPGSRVDVPRTAETMPNGEADMVIVRMRKSIGLG